MIFRGFGRNHLLWTSGTVNLKGPVLKITPLPFSVVMKTMKHSEGLETGGRRIHVPVLQKLRVR